MLPCFAVANRCYSRVVDAELFCQRQAGNSRSTDCSDGLLRKFCVATWGAAAPFGVAISHVVCIGPKKQMAWVYTVWCVASVADKQRPIPDRTIVHFIGSAMRKDTSIRRTPLADESVTSANLRTYPKPAIIRPGLFDLRPKAFRHWFKCTRIDHLLCPDADRRLAHDKRRPIELLAALQCLFDLLHIGLVNWRVAVIRVRCVVRQDDGALARLCDR